ncbi:MAG: succinate dehydrogenase iron-sulfur subunit [Chloroflexota bacterium]|nr:succinate dehydrogenase iron-sulfur subunit [Chloroflexia bacterium]MDQ3466902.1 succinate dehydrogenase iron-sulfur subunit [Chloroflexota bacterium]
MEVTLRIKRFNPEQDVKPAFKEYVVDVEPMDRVLDALNQVKWQHDGTLTYRRSCAHGICGSDAMRINGRNRLACKMLMNELGRKVTIEPLIGFKVIKDLVIDMDQFFASYKAVKPYLIADDAPSAGERLQSPAERERFDDTTKCILCAACTTACPITWTNEEFVGPAAIVNAHRFIFDSRDQGAGERLRILNTQSGVWRCRTIFNCTEVCPRDIEVTKAIEEVKRALLFEQV